MVTYVKDLSGRFPQRPHYKPEELDHECEYLVTEFLRKRYGAARFPISTDDLTRLIEREADSLDLYADLSQLGSSVEGVTQFVRGAKPRVSVSAALSENSRMENRLRTTLTHEYGHVHWHAYLVELFSGQGTLFDAQVPERVVCKRGTMIDAPQSDWMEWQAGHVCGAILMPAGSVRRLLDAHVQKNGLVGAVGALSGHARTMIQQVMEEFQVSEQAARVRLLRLKFITGGESQGLLFEGAR